MSDNNLWQQVTDGLKTWARVNSPWVIHFNSGSCNGCDIEILATLTPRYDMERMGVRLEATPAPCGCFVMHRRSDPPGTRAADPDL